MATSSALRDRIASERHARASYVTADFVSSVESGKGQEVLDSLIFFAAPEAFVEQVGQLRTELDQRFDQVNVDAQKLHLRFLIDLTVSLGSFLSRWNLLSTCQHERPLTGHRLAEVVGANRALLGSWEARASKAARVVREELRSHAAARYQAEAADDPEAQANTLVGDSLVQYVDNMASAVARSNLRQIAVMRDQGLTRTELGNDYAAFLQYTMYLGASFVTTNPVLVDIAWAADPDYWNRVVDSVVAGNMEADEATLARLCTLEVVLANMRLLRPIFLLTQGEMGSVSLQVNPKKHGDVDSMVSDVLSIYGELEAKLDGGVPNVVFKLPATRAGLEACREVTSRGIGVNITVNFGMFQQTRFAEAIEEGQAIFSCLTEMNGRLAYPVRDELLGKLDQLAMHGIDEAQAREAAAWSGVAVIKRLEELMMGKGYDPIKIKPLVASLRVYDDGSGYDRLPSAFPDISEQVGTSIITVFPNVRHAFDARPPMSLEPRRVEQPVPDHVLEVLAHSEIFRQAYYVADPSWVADDSRFRPDYELVLEDEDKVFEYPPVHDTLVQFGEGYDRFVQRILERRAILGGVG